MLNIEDIERHWKLSAASVRHLIRSGDLTAIKIAGRFRTTWPDVWACEHGGQPTPSTACHYTCPLLTKQDVAALMDVSARTIERWVQAGLPTRSVGRSIRFSRYEVENWVRDRFGIAPSRHDLFDGWEGNR